MTPLSKQGQYARGSVLPVASDDAFITLVGGNDLFNAIKQGKEIDTEKIYGCNFSDFADSDFDGKFALIYRGKCKFEEKIINAANNSAKGVVIVNNQQDGVITMSIGGKYTNKSRTSKIFGVKSKNFGVRNAKKTENSV